MFDFKQKFDKEEITVVIVGRVGAGKSFAINKFLGKEIAKSGTDPNGVTKAISKVSSHFAN